MTSQCPFCGSPVRPGAAFCANCGHTLPTTTSLLATAIPAGTELRGRYVVSKRLGGGGSGDVYLANDKGLFNRQVVVKRLKINETDPKDRIEAERNFTREAEALAGLNNPHFPQILDFFIDGPSQFLVMEFVAGEDLSKIIERAKNPLPEPEVLYYGLQIAELLVYLHDRDEPITHRDIKPANIIVNQAKQATLVDFGIARSKGRPGGPNAADPRDSAAWGTPGYAPPEQVAGQTVPGSDIYALGATLHHLITNRDPRDHVDEPFPPARSLNPNISPAFSDLLARMLSEDWHRRPDADHLLLELQQIAVSARMALATDTLPPTASLPPNPPPAQPTRQAPIAPPQRQVGAALALGGVQVTNVPMLVALSDKNWEEARRKLYSGEIARWLRGIGETQLAAQAEATTISTPDHDMGLETLLHRADPMLQQPRLEIEPGSINVGTVNRGDRKRQQWSARNTGRGTLVARVRGQASWVQATPNVITLRAGQAVTGTIEVTQPNLPGRQVATVLADAGPAGQASIEVQATAAITGTGQSGGRGIGGFLRFILILIFLAALAVAAIAVFNGRSLPSLLPTPTSFVLPPIVTLATAQVSPVVIAPPAVPDATSWTTAGYSPERSYYNPNESPVAKTIIWQETLPPGEGNVAKLLVSPDRIYTSDGAIFSLSLAQKGAQVWRIDANSVSSDLSLTKDLLLTNDVNLLKARHTEDGSQAWSAPLSGAPIGSPLILNDRVYQSAGSTINSFDLDGGGNPVAFSGTSGVLLTQPAAMDDDIVATDIFGVVYRWIATGEVEWSKATGSRSEAFSAASPVGVMGGNIYYLARSNNASSAVAINGAGQPLWIVPVADSIQSAPALADDFVYFSTSNSVIALSATSGTQLWEADLSDLTTARGQSLIAEPPTVAGRLIYVATGNGVVVTLNRNDNGAVLGQLSVTRANHALLHNPVAAAGQIFVVDVDRQVYELGE